MKSRFQLIEIGLASIRQCRPLLDRVARRDPHLADQLRRALIAAPLLASEGNQARKGNRAAKLQAAQAEAAEAETALRIVVALGYATADEITAALDSLGHFQAIARKLSR